MRPKISLPPALAAIAAGRDHIKTAEFAKAINRANQTIRKNYCLTGECFKNSRCQPSHPSSSAPCLRPPPAIQPWEFRRKWAKSSPAQISHELTLASPMGAWKNSAL